MKLWLFKSTLALGLAVLVSGPLATSRAGAPEWIKDYDAAKAAARASGKPMFVVVRCER